MSADLTPVYNVSEKVDDKIFFENIVRKNGKIIVISAIYTTANQSVSKKDISFKGCSFKHVTDLFAYCMSSKKLGIFCLGLRKNC